MKQKTRACIAYIAGTIVSRRSKSTIYDCTKSEYINVDGDISLEEVNLYDHSRKCLIAGVGKNGQFKLYDFGNENRINLSINGHFFDGFDFDTSEDFGGSVNGNNISVYDYEYSRWFNYCI
jgi:hypothetical protein